LRSHACKSAEFWRSAFFITVTIIAVAAIIALIVKTHERLPLYAFSTHRGRSNRERVGPHPHGEVVDFIQWYVRT